MRGEFLGGRPQGVGVLGLCSWPQATSSAMLRPACVVLFFAAAATVAAAASVLATAGQCCDRECHICMDPETQPFCAASQANCEGKCKHHWCNGGGGGGGGNYTVDRSRPGGLSFCRALFDSPGCHAHC